MPVMADTRQQLAQAGADRRAARARANELSREVRRLARKAHAEGVPKAEIARLAKISRVTLDEWLGH